MSRSFDIFSTYDFQLDIPDSDDDNNVEGDFNLGINTDSDEEEIFASRRKSRSLFLDIQTPSDYKHASPVEATSFLWFSSCVNLLEAGTLGEAHLKEEFERLKVGSSHMDDEAFLPKNKLRPIVSARNRYPKLSVSNRNRVCIQSELDSIGYINANRVKAEFLSGVNTEFIATQGPKAETMGQFWTMVWEQDSHIIVMLTRLREFGRRRCHKYWPDSEDLTFDCGITVHLNDEQETVDSEGYVFMVIRTFTITNEMFNESREVVQLQYRSWLDMSTPDIQEYDTFYNSYMQYKRAQKGKEPVIVHCSAGIGRTGVFITTEILLEHCSSMINSTRDEDSVIPCIDLPTTLYELRKQRHHMVQSQSQYSFIYAYLYHCVEDGLHGLDVTLRESRLAAEASFTVQSSFRTKNWNNLRKATRSSRKFKL